jgi:hypothetical protein
MVKQSPRIYVYKITFEEVQYYYYGSHKEKRFGEYYMGSPVKNKWAWEFYTPKIQILQFFDFTDEGYKEAREIETRLIRPFLNTDKWCLNECCGGVYSLKVLRENGKKQGKKTKELGLGIFQLTEEQRRENSKKAIEKQRELGIGVFNIPTEQRRVVGRRSGQKCKENGTGIFAMTEEQKSENGKKTVEIHRKLGIGFFGLTSEQQSNSGKKGGKTSKERGVGIFALTKEQRRENVKKVNSQRWQCTVTGFVSSAGPLSCYQKARGIDTSNRIRIE